MAKKIEKGSGGKLGHSNRDGWETHQEEKEWSRIQRRLEAKKLATKAMKDELLD